MYYISINFRYRGVLVEKPKTVSKIFDSQHAPHFRPDKITLNCEKKNTELVRKNL